MLNYSELQKIKKNMKSIVFIVLIVISLTVLIFILTAVDNVFSLYTLGITVWAVAPWLYIATVSFFIKNTAKLISILSVASIVGVLSVGIMVDVLFFHLDAQGGLVFIFIPLWQLIFFVFVTPVLLFIGKKST